MDDSSRIAVLESEMRELKIQFASIAADVRTTRDAILESKGGWKMLMLLGGGAAVVGGLVVKVFESFMMAFPK